MIDPAVRRRSTPSRPAVAGLVLAAVLVLLLLIAPEVVLIGFAGVLLAAFLDGGTQFISKYTRLPRMAALPLFMLLIVGGFGLVGWFAAPVIAEQADQLSEQVPKAYGALKERLQSQPWSRSIMEQVKPDKLMSAGQAIAGGATSALSATFGAFGNLAMILILGIFLAGDPGTYRKGVRSLFPPERRAETDQVLDELRDVLRGWLMAQLGSMAVIGLLTGLGLWVLGIPLVVALGVLAAVLTFIPNLGPILAAVPALLLALSSSPVTALWVAGLYVAVQLIEGNVTTPLIQQQTISLPPALTIAMQLLLGVLFGILGLALAVPITAVGITLVRLLYVEHYMERQALPE